jgi:hypothetical protein
LRRRNRATSKITRSGGTCDAADTA